MGLVKIYRNGSYKVQINLDTGTRYYFGDSSKPDFPDSIDLKITQWCPHGCSFCYEESGGFGKHCNTDSLLKTLEVLPKVPLEVAIGGGSAPDHPDFKKIKNFLIDRGNIANLTITQRDLDRFDSDIYSGISGLGISVGSGLIIDPNIKIDGIKQIVFHVIAGITPLKDIQSLIDASQRVLVLGYKNMGRAKKESIPNLKDVESLLKRSIGRTMATIVFDDLSINQLNIRAAVVEDSWKTLYQGPEFSHSMFIDAVEEKFYPSSTDRTNGVLFSDMNILNYFSKNHVRDSY